MKMKSFVMSNVQNNVCVEDGNSHVNNPLKHQTIRIQGQTINQNDDDDDDVDDDDEEDNFSDDDVNNNHNDDDCNDDDNCNEDDDDDNYNDDDDCNDDDDDDVDNGGGGQIRNYISLTHLLLGYNNKLITKEDLHV